MKSRGESVPGKGTARCKAPRGNKLSKRMAGRVGMQSRERAGWGSRQGLSRQGLDPVGFSKPDLGFYSK